MAYNKVTKNKNSKRSKNNKTKNNNKTKINNKTKSTHNLQGGSSEKPDNADFIYYSQNISTQQNKDKNYREIGVIHITESAAINALKGFATGVVNIFGAKGFDNSVYDSARNVALNKIMKQIDKTKQKICNLRMEVENNPQSSLFFIHLYGTLLEKKN